MILLYYYDTIMILWYSYSTLILIIIVVYYYANIAGPPGSREQVVERLIGRLDPHTFRRAATPNSMRPWRAGWTPNSRRTRGLLTSSACEAQANPFIVNLFVGPQSRANWTRGRAATCPSSTRPRLCSPWHACPRISPGCEIHPLPLKRNRDVR